MTSLEAPLVYPRELFPFAGGRGGLLFARGGREEGSLIFFLFSLAI